MSVPKPYVFFPEQKNFPEIWGKQLEEKSGPLPRPTQSPIPHPTLLKRLPSCGKRVGLAGFEPTASSSRTRRATRLRYSPLWRGF